MPSLIQQCHNYRKQETGNRKQQAAWIWQCMALSPLQQAIIAGNSRPIKTLPESYSCSHVRYTIVITALLNNITTISNNFVTVS